MREGTNFEAFVAGDELAADGSAGVSDEDLTLAGGGVSAKQVLDLDAKVCLFLDLTLGRFLQHLADVDEAGRKGPHAGLGLVGAAAEDDLASLLDDDANGDFRVFEVDVTAVPTDATDAAKDLLLFKKSAADEAVLPHI